MKLYTIFNGNNVVSLGLNNEKEMTDTYNTLVKNNWNEYVIYELLEFEIEDNNFIEGLNILALYKINDKPHKPIVRNDTCIFYLVDVEGEYRRVDYDIYFISANNGKYQFHDEV